MSPSIMLRLLSAALLLAGLSACDRAPRGPAATATPAAAATPQQAGATTAPMPGAAVALSGAVRDLPPATTPDSMAGKPLPPPPAGVRLPPPMDDAPLADTALPGETAAMREFREAQARRDRELLERDMAAAQGGYARNEGAPPRDEDLRPYDDAPPYDEDLPPEDDLPRDEDLPPYDADPPPDEDLPLEDEELRWDPATGTWR